MGLNVSAHEKVTIGVRRHPGDRYRRPGSSGNAGRSSCRGRKSGIRFGFSRSYLAERLVFVNAGIRAKYGRRVARSSSRRIRNICICTRHYVGQWISNRHYCDGYSCGCTRPSWEFISVDTSAIQYFATDPLRAR